MQRFNEGFGRLDAYFVLEHDTLLTPRGRPAPDGQGSGWQELGKQGIATIISSLP